jgi:hypothetical protein
MNQNCVSANVSNHDGIACVAFQLWEKAGRPEGRDVEFWLEAETSIVATQRPEAQKTKLSSAKTARF